MVLKNLRKTKETFFMFKVSADYLLYSKVINGRKGRSVEMPAVTFLWEMFTDILARLTS